MHRMLTSGRVALALSLIAALVVVSPALGGPSLSKLLKKQVRKEVSKQIGKAKGEPGVNGAANVVYRRTTQNNVSVGAAAFQNASCQSGEKLIGGGAGFVQQAGQLNYDAIDSLSANGPGVATGPTTATPVADGSQPDVWHASGTNGSGSTRDFVVYAICAKP